MMTTSFKFVFRKSNGETGNDPWGYIYRLIIHNRKKSYKSIGLPRIRKSQWHPVRQKVRNIPGEESLNFNRVIDDYKRDYFNRLGGTKEKSRVKNSMSLLDYMEGAILGSEFRDKHGTRTKYLTVLKKLRGFLADRNLTDLTFYALDVEVLYDFQSYMLDTGITQNSATHYLKIIQSFVRRSLKDRNVLNNNNPF